MDSVISIENSSEIATPKEEEPSGFKKFVKDFQKANYDINNSWNKARDKYFKELSIKRRIVMRELNQFDEEVKSFK